MPPQSNPRGKTRRDVMAILGVAGAAGLAGCVGDDDDPGVTPTPTPRDDDTPTPTPRDEPERQVMGTYRSGISSDAETTIPFMTTDTTSGAYQDLVLDGAYAVSTAEFDDAIFPLWLDFELAEGSETVYVATLRDNLEWSDPYGPMTSDDWVFYIENIHKSEDNWAGSVDAPDWAEIETEVVDDQTFELTLPEINPDFPWEPVMWNAKILPRGLIEDYVDDQDLEGIQQDTEIIEMGYTGNTGAFTLSEWDRDSAWRTVRNDDYYLSELSPEDFPDWVPEDEIDAWLGAPYFEGYEYDVIPEESTRLSALRTGEIDTTGIPEPRVAEFQEAVDDVYVNLAPQPYLRVMSYSMRLSGWEAWTDEDPDYDGQGEVGYGHENSREIRWAIATAIDKQFISDEIEQGLSDPAQTFQPEWSRWYIDDDVEPVGVGDSYSHDDARDMLETYLPDGYGYDNGALIGPEGHDRWDGEQVELTWVHTAGIETYDLTAEHVMAELDAIGIDMDINTVLWETLLGQWLATEAAEGVDETMWNVGPDNRGHPHETVHISQWDLLYGINFNTYPRTPAATDVFWTLQAPLNYYGYMPPDDMGPDGDWTMEEAFAAGRQEIDEDARLEIFGEIFATLSHDIPNNFVTMGVDHTGYQNRVLGPSEEFGYGWNWQNNYYDAELI